MADGISRAYVAGLKMLARRERSEAQLRTRLARKEFEPEEIDSAIARLRGEKALDDRRTALACARDAVTLKRQGRARVLRTVESLGVDRAVARAAVAEVFAELDEHALLEEALDRRLRRGQSLADAADVRRVHRYLLGQGFDPGRVLSAIRGRTKATRFINDD